MHDVDLCTAMPTQYPTYVATVFNSDQFNLSSNSKASSISKTNHLTQHQHRREHPTTRIVNDQTKSSLEELASLANCSQPV